MDHWINSESNRLITDRFRVRVPEDHWKEGDVNWTTLLQTGKKQSDWILRADRVHATIKQRKDFRKKRLDILKRIYRKHCNDSTFK